MMNDNQRAGQPPSSERLFTAVRLSPDIRSRAGELCRAMSAELPFAKWTHAEDYHITLQFLGDTPILDIPALTASLRQASERIEPFTLTLREPGIFGPPEAPRVLWAGVGGDKIALRELYARITGKTAPLGFRAENRPYSPHVTLARRYRGTEPFHSGKLGVWSDHELFRMSWKVEEWVLFATRMHNQPMYEVVETFRF
ncbi:RNA 2',3'-cyclic phosphodiesterase [Paenibacillus sp. HN-1]|uniref:RNA 2',3'-cyclic phosphodiesterase n=1 Tax=Paenibacillus TaxID=44249 RepID=UPI001CA7C7AC|nr:MULTISPECIES: RNA 2',3'-cyclic phosphodiesterase [Paenibacillus]MBY9081281.1 RNA 2',3'-cyclic phosphodiesterase [Paenibacillus sp. CGMCC 1.18879]MBY9087554.1 RNA 2',3'-cyclic phosphodiesterase [Paenibacillus sinensis]